MLAGRECVLVRVFDFLEASRLRRHMQMKRRGKRSVGSRTHPRAPSVNVTC